ncbi:MAG: LysR family transcriptional regulator [Burkholderiaceae bacterium]|nr:LysR family transcriptional regulator [Burkholderiaceae bacterium]MBP7420321.1 LysR family transcriptional regulator [Burkholderiaceae bacterium]
MSTTPTAQLLNRLRMRQVALLLAIGQHRTLRAAAAQLGLTQPAATKMLQELESAMGHALFDRVGRGLQLTAAGHCVLAYFEGLQGHFDALTRELGELEQGSAGKLCIGSIMAASPAVLTQALIRLKALYPLLTIEITVDTSDRLSDALRRGDLDLVIGRVPDTNAGAFSFSPIAEEALSIVASPQHPLAGQARVAWAELLAYPWILQPHGSPMREVMEHEFKNQRSPLPRGLIETASILTTTNLIGNSDMLAVMPTEVAERYEAHGLLACLRYTVRQRLSVYGTIAARDRPAGPAATQLMQFLRSATAEAPQNQKQ